jgi:hypothetical protein
MPHIISNQVTVKIKLGREGSKQAGPARITSARRGQKRADKSGCDRKEEKAPHVGALLLLRCGLVFLVRTPGHDL